MTHSGVKMCYVLKKFLSLQFCGPHAYQHGVWVLSKHCHLQLYPKLGHRVCEIVLIPCVYVSLKNILDRLWFHGVSHTKQPFYQPLVGCTYQPVLSTYKNTNIIFSNKTTSNNNLMIFIRLTLMAPVTI